MTGSSWMRAVSLSSAVVALATSGCAFRGVNSLPLPGTVGRGADANVYHVQIDSVGTLELNSPVMMSDVVVGTVTDMSVDNWHADVKVSVKPDVVVPANAVATIGQTSLLGSMHLALDPPAGQQARGRLQSGATLPLNTSSTYPSTEQTLSSLSTILNGGSLGRISDIIHESNAALAGREGQVRDLLGRLNDIAGVLSDQRDDVVTTMQELSRLSGTLAQNADTIDSALRHIPAALEVLARERPRITAALARLGTFSDTASGLIEDTKDDLIRNLTNLEPALRAIADLGPDLDTVLAYLTTFPFTQNVIDRGLKGDYMNLFVTLDLTYPRIRRTLALGTRWAEPHAPLVAAPGDPWFENYTYDPLDTGVAAATPAPATPPPPAATGEPVLPVSPRQDWAPSAPGAPPPPGQIFAGPYGGR